VKKNVGDGDYQTKNKKKKKKRRFSKTSVMVLKKGPAHQKNRQRGTPANVTVNRGGGSEREEGETVLTAGKKSSKKKNECNQQNPALGEKGAQQ